jgi:hypothetical protein
LRKPQTHKKFGIFIMQAGFVMLMLMMMNTPVAGRSFIGATLGPYSDSVLVTWYFRNKPSTRILRQKKTSRELLFRVEREDKKAYQFFVFDMNSRLVQQTRIMENEVALLTGFVKGNYLFEILSNDERVESGSISVR